VLGTASVSDYQHNIGYRAGKLVGIEELSPVGLPQQSSPQGWQARRPSSVNARLTAESAFSPTEFALFQPMGRGGGKPRVPVGLARDRCEGRALALAGCAFLRRDRSVIAPILGGIPDGEQPCSRRHSSTWRDLIMLEPNIAIPDSTFLVTPVRKY
jgi:hypothetical protein